MKHLVDLVFVVFALNLTAVGAVAQERDENGTAEDSSAYAESANGYSVSVAAVVNGSVRGGTHITLNHSDRLELAAEISHRGRKLSIETVSKTHDLTFWWY